MADYQQAYADAQVVIGDQANRNHKLRCTLAGLIGFAGTCRRINNAEWMAAFAGQLNAACKAINDDDWFIYNSDGFDLVKPAALANTEGTTTERPKAISAEAVEFPPAARAALDQAIDRADTEQFQD